MLLEPFGRWLVVGVTPFAEPNAQLVAAVERAGGLGVLDLGRDRQRALGALADAARWVPGSFGVRIGPGCPLPPEDLPAESTPSCWRPGLRGRWPRRRPAAAGWSWSRCARPTRPAPRWWPVPRV